MYLKKVDGPRTVKMPDGTVLTRADLPPPETTRWVASRKAAVVRGLNSGLITTEEALERWSLSEEELDEWIMAVDKHGLSGLKVTKLQEHRQP